VLPRRRCVRRRNERRIFERRHGRYLGVTPVRAAAARQEARRSGSRGGAGGSSAGGAAAREQV
jgi:hypothetical protein